MADPKPKASLRAVVSGRVQGVFFRMFVMKEARALGLCGSVRNLSDGTVEVHAEGARPGLERLAERLMQGPPAAMVQGVEIDWSGYCHDFDSFDIEYT